MAPSHLLSPRFIQPPTTLSAPQYIDGQPDPRDPLNPQTVGDPTFSKGMVLNNPVITNTMSAESSDSPIPTSNVTPTQEIPIPEPNISQVIVDLVVALFDSDIPHDFPPSHETPPTLPLFVSRGVRVILGQEVLFGTLGFALRIIGIFVFLLLVMTACTATAVLHIVLAATRLATAVVKCAHVVHSAVDALAILASSLTALFRRDKVRRTLFGARAVLLTRACVFSQK
jgi:hypothetical protein